MLSGFSTQKLHKIIIFQVFMKKISPTLAPPSTFDGGIRYEFFKGFEDFCFTGQNLTERY